MKLGDLSCFSSVSCPPIPAVLQTPGVPAQAPPSLSSAILSYPESDVFSSFAAVDFPYQPTPSFWSDNSSPTSPHSHGILGHCCVSSLTQLRTGYRKTRQCIHDLTSFEWLTPHILPFFLKLSPLSSPRISRVAVVPQKRLLQDKSSSPWGPCWPHPKHHPMQSF